MAETAREDQRDSSSEAVADRGDPRWLRLRAQIQTHAFKTGSFVLTSGRTSNFMFQLRFTTLHPEGAALAADLIIDFMRARRIKYIGGLVQGAVPIVASVAARSFGAGDPVFAFFVRKEAKQHGTRERIDGFTGAEGDEILVVDDVATTGGSLLKTIAALKEEGLQRTARTALVIVDREEGARENLAAEGIEMVSLFKKSDFATAP
ncbi:MAG TPA: orotate phosphoribosyltransferase [Methylocystis sp.]|nr:orotate phosphoribosyltransferase [Methylocystis sp.]